MECHLRHMRRAGHGHLSPGPCAWPAARGSASLPRTAWQLCVLLPSAGFWRLGCAPQAMP
eukprot:11073665-Lingulodinium_polyedra.AAC.1